MNNDPSNEVSMAIETAIPLRALSFSGWLKHIKNLSKREINRLYDDKTQWDNLNAEYGKWVKDRQPL